MSREAMQMALEALESDPVSHLGLVHRKLAITALRQALEQQPVEERLGYWNAVEGWVDLPEPDQAAAWVEPEFWQHLEKVNCGTAYRLPSESRQPLYTAPPKKQWVGLTDEEHDNIKDNYHNMTWTLEMFARAVEQALKEKNT
jgi:hypothetical protein